MSGVELHGKRDNVLNDRLRLNGLVDPPPISVRHREWGRNVPAVDLDMVAVEYDMATPVAVIDYKYGLGTVVNMGHASMRALGRFHSPAGPPLPAFVARYAVDPWQFALEPLNTAGAQLLHAHGIEPRTVLEEDTFITFIYSLRGRQAPPIGQHGRTA
jgi:hypothetical protein